MVNNRDSARLEMWLERCIDEAHGQLANTEEIENGKSNGALGEIFIRCNNVLYIRCVNLTCRVRPPLIL